MGNYSYCRLNALRRLELGRHPQQDRYSRSRPGPLRRLALRRQRHLQDRARTGRHIRDLLQDLLQDNLQAHPLYNLFHS